MHRIQVIVFNLSEHKSKHKKKEIIHICRNQDKMDIYDIKIFTARNRPSKLGPCLGHTIQLTKCNICQTALVLNNKGIKEFAKLRCTVKTCV